MPTIYNPRSTIHSSSPRFVTQRLDGIHGGGAVSFAVSQCTKELGIRMALGAGRLDILREVFLSGGKPVVQGLLADLWLSVEVAAGLRHSVQGSSIQLDTANPLLYCSAAPPAPIRWRPCAANSTREQKGP